MKHDLAALGVTAALPALELIDFRHSGKALGTDVIADGVYAKAIVLAGALTPVTGIDLALEGLVYAHNHLIRATYTRLGSVSVRFA